jgi:hypothetical protein
VCCSIPRGTRPPRGCTASSAASPPTPKQGRHQRRQPLLPERRRGGQWRQPLRHRQ